MEKVEELVVGKDEVVRGAKLKVFSKGKPVYLSRPIQRLYPVEVGRGCKVYWMTRKQGKTMVRKCLQVLGEHQNLPLRLTQTGKLERCLTLSPSLRSRGGVCRVIIQCKINIINLILLIKDNGQIETIIGSCCCYENRTHRLQ